MKTKIQFANEGQSAVTLVGFYNEIAIDADGWAMIAPLGDFPSMAITSGPDGKLTKQEAIQRYDAAAVNKIVANFHNSRRERRKYLRGIPIYVGHPDVPGLERRYPDKTPKGVFADLQARDNGLFGLPVFTNEGSELVETKKLRAFSGRAGNSEPDGEKDGLPVFRPTELFSAGLTNKPHLPVQYLNEADVEDGPAKTKPGMNKKLSALCAALGIQFANDADDAATEAALDQISQKVATFANEKQTLIDDAKTQVAAMATLTTERTALTTDRDSARASFTNERAARIGDELGLALSSGRITAAQQPTWLNRLKVEASFANELSALRTLHPTVKTESVTLQRGDRKIELANPQQRAEFCNELYDNIAKKEGLDRKRDFNKIFNIAQRQHPALFANMQQPETPGRKK
jgi:hypothetical protein